MPPRPPPANRSTTVQETLEQAALALRAGRFGEAERLALGVLKSNWGNGLAAQVLGQAMLQDGRPAEAVEPLARAARRAADPALDTLLARILLALGRTDEALARLGEATRRRPAWPPAFLELGDRLGKLGRFDEAIAVFAEGLALTPDAIVLTVGLAYVHLARHDRAQARRLFAAVGAAAPERRDALLGLAGVLRLEGEAAAAADLYRQALSARPDDAEARLGLAACLLELDQRDAGEAALREAVRASGAQGPAVTALASAPHGRLFLRPSDAARFLGC